MNLVIKGKDSKKVNLTSLRIGGRGIETTYSNANCDHNEAFVEISFIDGITMLIRNGCNDLIVTTEPVTIEYKIKS